MPKLNDLSAAKEALAAAQANLTEKQTAFMTAQQEVMQAHEAQRAAQVAYEAACAAAVTDYAATYATVKAARLAEAGGGGAVVEEPTTP